MDVQEFSQTLEKVNHLYSHRDYEAALKLVQELLSYSPYSTELLIKYAKLIQLLDKDNLDGFPSLSESFESLKLSYSVAPQSIQTCIELGYFEYAVNTHTCEAIKYFRKAQESAENELKKALIGQIKCYIDLKDIFQAKQILNQAKELFPDDNDLASVEFELDE